MADNNEQIELADLLSETMKATIEADRQASEKYYEVLRSYAFKSASDGEETATQAGAQALEMVSFRIGNGDMRQEVSIPKLSLMPLPLLHIEEASFELNGEMSSTMEEKKQSMQKPVKKGRCCATGYSTPGFRRPAQRHRPERTIPLQMYASP